MSRRKKVVFVLAVAFVAAAVVAVVVWRGEREPEYQGKTLRQWLEVYYRAQLSGAPTDQPGMVVRAIGPKAIPILVRWMEQGRMGWRTRAYFALPIGVKRTAVGRLVGRPLDNVTLAGVGFEILGEQGLPAARQLERLAFDAEEPFVSYPAFVALLEIGERATEVVRSDLTNSDRHVREAAANVLWRLGL